MAARILKYFILLLVIAGFTFPASAENGKFYTKRALLEDFTAKMTKIVLTGDAIADAVIREETSTRWDLSPFEFCTVDDYEALKESSNYYFLHFVKYDDVLFLSLDKGGTKDDPDIKKRCFEVVSIPVSGADRQTMENLGYMPAFIDIIQEFVELAMTSDSKAYSGIQAFNRSLAGKEICLDAGKAGELFAEEASDVLVGVTASAERPHIGSWCYKMLISCDTHELYYVQKHKISTNRSAGWLDSEIRRFNGNTAE